MRLVGQIDLSRDICVEIKRLLDDVGKSGSKTEECNVRMAAVSQRDTTEREDREIVRTAVIVLDSTLSTIHRVTDTQGCKITFNRRLREQNLKARRPLRCLPLTPVHRQVRLQWCRERSTWNCADWECIVFSDESRFLLCPDDRHKHVWRCPGQRVDPGLTFKHHTGPQQGVRVWGAISFYSRTPLVVIPGTLTAQHTSSITKIYKISRVTKLHNITINHTKYHQATLNFTKELSRTFKHLAEIKQQETQGRSEQTKEAKLKGGRGGETNRRSPKRSRGHGCCDLHFRRLAPGFHSRAKAKTSLEDDDVPIDDTTTKPLSTPQEKGRKGTRDKVPRLRCNYWQKHVRSMTCNNCPDVELTPTHIFSCLAMAAALKKIDMDPEQQLYTLKIENIAVIEIFKHKNWEVFGGLHNPLNFQLPLTSERRAKDHIISSLSNKLLDFLEDNSLTIVNGRSRGDKDGDFTYISERGSSTIDYCILSQGSLQILLDFKVDDQLYSDHHPLVLTIKGQNFNEKKTKREDYNITRYRWSADGLAMFKMKLEELREKNIPASDDLVYTFNQRILEAMSSAKITYSIKGGPRKSKPWFDKDCYDMKKLAKESLKKYRKTNRLEDRECYASSRKKYLALLDLKRKGFDNEKQEILRNAKDSKTFWKTIALYKSTSIIQGEISIQDWLNFYRELMTTEKNLRICNLHNVISQNDPILDSEITNADIYKEIAGLRSNKACGPDGIPNEVLKTLPDSYILLLKQLYNSVMTTGKYPAIWTNSTIHPIFKNGYKNSPSNYRGIALISNVSKLFTSTLRSRLEEWVEGRRVIPEKQAGFRKGRSCIDHIFTLTTLIQLSLRKKRGKLYVFFVDLRKAFDTVPHSILWKKLYNLGISYQFISTIRSYYEQATIAIRWKGSFTESIKINSGVLQGEPLSPLLFILFITDLIEIYNNSDLPSVNLPEFGDIHLLLHADDIAIIGESRMNLQKKIKILKEYLDENLMTLNESKSKIMVFRNGGKPSNKDRWFWNDKPITITSRYTYLGFPLTPTITTTHPANYFKGKALTAINATYPILIKSKAKSINLSIKLFDTIVRAVLMYAAPLWATEHKDLLDNIQDIFIRRFLNLLRYTPGYLIRLETGRISLSVTALKLTLKYWLRVLNMSSDRLPRICFNRTRELSNASGTPIGFIKKLTNLLNNNGSPALVSCDDPETLRSAITGLLKTAAGQSIQTDLTRMDKSKLYSHYKDIHISFMTEGYLLGVFLSRLRQILSGSGFKRYGNSASVDQISVTSGTPQQDGQAEEEYRGLAGVRILLRAQRSRCDAVSPDWQGGELGGPEKGHCGRLVRGAAISSSLVGAGGVSHAKLRKYIRAMKPGPLQEANEIWSRDMSARRAGLTRRTPRRSLFQPNLSKATTKATQKEMLWLDIRDAAGVGEAERRSTFGSSDRPKSDKEADSVVFQPGSDRSSQTRI
ncbi:hypothetical protein LAZ67_3002812 [Cordylochernes scorpioides]|uniref:Reverse transcriptase domain-containing protein n=1 Tax=Cordylochernes scorpioides TaxID=51811 RepID=A0ABY6K9T9_9ARAC|nr:hypothetical protein LAZ67_3002812 [Cordylochernes scorpioides]